jgi:hypothetical protein
MSMRFLDTVQPAHVSLLGVGAFEGVTEPNHAWNPAIGGHRSQQKPATRQVTRIRHQGLAPPVKANLPAHAPASFVEAA